MSYYMLLLLFTGTAGISSFLYQRKRIKAFRERINIAEQPVPETEDIIAGETSTEKLLRRNGKGIVIASMLDKNIALKAAVVIFIAIVLQLLEKFDILTLSATVMACVLLVSLLLVILLPGKIKKMIIDSRVRRICNDLPYIIDIMAICVQSGMTIENTIRYLAENTETINPDISVLLARTIMKMEVSGMSEALDLLYNEVPSQEIRMLASTLQQSIKFGSSIYLLLLDLSREIREMQLLAIDEKISSLAAKMSLPMIICIMFPILVLVAGPGVIRIVALWSGQ
ncbi:type II secretion system F family protein [Citrobacter rodentium]|uniref:Tight adherence protein C n=3 Tax=Citrobacter rodentium TaxID=67825 RepID=D2TIT2_CITRI|nr:type II secretion system F family protein [Citrobacter rodentium]CBG90842.1 putative tight adherence protein C [Citrobacter rodentium ICC168]